MSRLATDAGKCRQVLKLAGRHDEKGKPIRIKEVRRRALDIARRVNELGETAPQRKPLHHELLKLVDHCWRYLRTEPPIELMEALAQCLGIKDYAPPGSIRHGKKEPDKFIRAMFAEKEYFDKEGKPASVNHIAKQVKASWPTIEKWRYNDPDYWLPFGGCRPKKIP